MFRKLGLRYLIAFGIVSFLWCMQFSYLRESDCAQYRARAVEARDMATSRPITSAKQVRSGVCKDIWFTQEDSSRLHTRIESDISHLTLLPRDRKIDIIENLEHLRCWMQEKLSTEGTEMQQVRYFEARNGIYQHLSQEFLAHSVALSLYRLPGHTLPLKTIHSTAFLKGIAQDVSFSISGKTPKFQATDFKASLNQKDG
jgi:hypothetical protein